MSWRRTDGGIVQDEREIYSQAGIPNADMLRTATWWPARLSGKDNMYGSIEAGKMANLILIDGNPLQDMRDERSSLRWYRGNCTGLKAFMGRMGGGITTDPGRTGPMGPHII